MHTTANTVRSLCPISKTRPRTATQRGQSGTARDPVHLVRYECEGCSRRMASLSKARRFWSLSTGVGVVGPRGCLCRHSSSRVRYDGLLQPLAIIAGARKSTSSRDYSGDNVAHVSIHTLIQDVREHVEEPWPFYEIASRNRQSIRCVGHDVAGVHDLIELVSEKR